MRYRDRLEAGQQLAEKLIRYANRADVLVLALPRGGVPVGFAVAEGLHAPLDVLLVRKLGVPGHEELAMGAIASGGVRVLNEEVVNFLQIPATVIDTVAAREQQELDRRSLRYRSDRPLTCMVAWSSWLTTVWRLARLCALPSWHCVNSSRPGSSLPFLWLPVPCAMSWKR
jgi:predicted phosphoribosyltransferase